MSLTIDYTETLTVCHCWCGIALAIPANLYRVAHESEHDVYCPLGHTFRWTDTFKAKLEAEQQRHRATRDLLAAEERSHRSTRGQLTKTRRRAQAGLCPCCNRTFQQLSRHMKSKHPDFKPEAASEETT